MEFLESVVSFLSAHVDLIVAFVSVVIGTLGVVLVFGIEKKAIFWSIVASVICWVAFEITSKLGGGLFLASFIGSALVAAYSDLMAHWLKVPATVLIIPGIIILVPGGKLYYTMLSAVRADMAAFSSYGKEALLIAAGLAIGIIAVTAISRPINARLNEIRLKLITEIKHKH